MGNFPSFPWVFLAYQTKRSHNPLHMNPKSLRITITFLSKPKQVNVPHTSPCINLNYYNLQWVLLANQSQHIYLTIHYASTQNYYSIQWIFLTIQGKWTHLLSHYTSTQNYYSLQPAPLSNLLAERFPSPVPVLPAAGSQLALLHAALLR